LVYSRPTLKLRLWVETYVPLNLLVDRCRGPLRVLASWWHRPSSKPSMISAFVLDKLPVPVNPPAAARFPKVAAHIERASKTWGRANRYSHGFLPRPCPELGGRVAGPDNLGTVFEYATFKCWVTGALLRVSLTVTLCQSVTTAPRRGFRQAGIREVRRQPVRAHHPPISSSRGSFAPSRVPSLLLFFLPHASRAAKNCASHSMSAPFSIYHHFLLVSLPRRSTHGAILHSTTACFAFVWSRTISPCSDVSVSLSLLPTYIGPPFVILCSALSPPKRRSSRWPVSVFYAPCLIVFLSITVEVFLFFLSRPLYFKAYARSKPRSLAQQNKATIQPCVAVLFLVLSRLRFLSVPPSIRRQLAIILWRPDFAATTRTLTLTQFAFPNDPFRRYSLIRSCFPPACYRGV